MIEILKEKFTARYKGPFVLFVLGFRINKRWKIHKWLPVSKSYRRMLEELKKDKNLGLLGVKHFRGCKEVLILQYWESLEKLLAYSNDPKKYHSKGAVKFMDSIGYSGDVGIWHELYMVEPGKYESQYANMPLTGIGTFGECEAVNDKLSKAVDRIKATL